MQDLESGVKKFLVANRIIFTALFLLTAIAITVPAGVNQSSTNIAILDPYTTLDFSSRVSSEEPDHSSDVFASEDSLNVPIAGDVKEDAVEGTEAEPASLIEQSSPATYTGSATYASHAPTAANVTPAAKEAATDAAPTVKKSASAKTATPATTSSDNSPSPYNYYVDDNGVAVDNSYVDNTPRYNLNSPVEEEPGPTAHTTESESEPEIAPELD